MRFLIQVIGKAANQHRDVTFINVTAVSVLKDVGMHILGAYIDN